MSSVATSFLFSTQLQAQLMELEEKAAVAGAGKLKAEEELAEVCATIHNKQQWALIVQLLSLLFYCSNYAYAGVLNQS